MAQCVSTRSPHKRGHGITNFIRNAILNDQRQLQKKSLIDDLLAKYKSHPRGISTAQHKAQDGEANQLMGRVVDGKGHPSCLGVCLHYKNRMSVENRRQLREELSKEKLRKRLSSDKNSQSPLGKARRSPSRRSKTNIFNHTSKPQTKNTEVSSFYKEALQQHNDKIKQLCVCEQEQLARVLVEIESEQKDQLFDRLVYEKSIDNLRRLASIGELGLESCGLFEDSGEETQEETRRE